MNHALFETLQERGYVYQCTNLQAVKTLLESDQKITFYLGNDTTADSLHIGHFFALMMFRHLQNAGHHGIVVIGGATAMIGDLYSEGILGYRDRNRAHVGLHRLCKAGRLPPVGVGSRLGESQRDPLICEARLHRVRQEPKGLPQQSRNLAGTGSHAP